MLEQSVGRLVDLIDPTVNRLQGISLEEAGRRIASGDPELVRGIYGSTPPYTTFSRADGSGSCASATGA